MNVIISLCLIHTNLSSLSKGKVFHEIYGAPGDLRSLYLDTVNSPLCVNFVALSIKLFINCLITVNF